MRLQIDEQKKEVKKHGSFQFPVRASFEQLSNFDQGAFAWHWHPEIELTYFVKGEMYYQINGQEYHAQEGDVLFCNTNAMHAGSMSNGGNCQYVSITFHPRMLYGFGGSEIEQEYVNPILENASLGAIYFQKGWKLTNVLYEKMQDVFKLFGEKPDLYQMQITMDLLEIWKNIYQYTSEQGKEVFDGNGRDVERLRKILDYIHGHYAEPLTLEDIAENVNLCKSECCRFFKRQMKQTIFQYLMAYRVSMSLQLLRDGANITEAGMQCGFMTPAYYSKVFKEVMGKSPREYMKEVH